MITDACFCHLSTLGLAKIIDDANDRVYYAAPGIQKEPAEALIRAAKRLGPEMIKVWVDFDERVFRMGYGEIDAVKSLRSSGVKINHLPKFRSAVCIIDDEGYLFTPTALYLETELGEESNNALRLSPNQIMEALVKFNELPKLKSGEPQSDEKNPFKNTVPYKKVEDAQFEEVAKNLEAVPPVNFDVARQVRVFEPYIQYVEISLKGTAIQRKRLTIPEGIQKLGGEGLEGRLKTTFEFLEKTSSVSSAPLEKTLNEIRKDLTRPLEKGNGRVILKNRKKLFKERLDELSKKLKTHKDKVGAEITNVLQKSLEQIADYYVPFVKGNPPDSLLGGSISESLSDEEVKEWIKSQLASVFPKPENMLKEMVLEVQFKDVTYETLNDPLFGQQIKEAYPNINWEKAFDEFKAAGEASQVKKQ